MSLAQLAADEISEVLPLELRKASAANRPS